MGELYGYSFDIQTDISFACPLWLLYIHSEGSCTGRCLPIPFASGLLPGDVLHDPSWVA